MPSTSTFSAAAASDADDADAADVGADAAFITTAATSFHSDRALNDDGRAMRKRQQIQNLVALASDFLQPGQAESG